INTSRIAFVLNVYDAFVSTNETAGLRRINILQSNGDLEITWPNVPEDVSRILILDATGRMLKIAVPGQGSTRSILPLNEIPTGVLFLQTEWSDGKTSSKAFVKD
ncbi:MAG: hypothetical protein KA165_18910, partial [Saprospiraceae bacterium]|nr:hypothetical protein [Saprospiraceae bacterium]